jgi:hypothetical protein
MGDRRGAYRIFVERERERHTPVGKRPLGRPRHRWG